jgi:hypothetical protein
MVIGLANSSVGYIPKPEAFSQGGYEVRTAWTSQLDHYAGEYLVELITDKILNNLLHQSVQVMERNASDNKYLHRDFHVAFNLLLTNIYEHFGKEGMTDYLRQFSRTYHHPLNQKLKNGDLDILASYFKDIYQREEWPVEIICEENMLCIVQGSCPAISHIVKKGGSPCPYYKETYNTVYQALCEDTPFEYILEYFDNETGACKQQFIRKEKYV